LNRTCRSVRIPDLSGLSIEIIRAGLTGMVAGSRVIAEIQPIDFRKEV
jgi:hypothetical protein